MSRRIKIAPSLLAADLAHIGEQMSRVYADGADMVHVDVMDGHFAPNLTFGPAIVAALDRCCEIPISTHLMVTSPEEFIEPFIEAGSNDLFFHIETPGDHIKLARRIKGLGARPGVVLEMDTPAERVAHLAGEIGILLVMTVRCGYTGQKFHPGPIEKIPALRETFGDEVDIAVDGGVSVENAGAIGAAGANVLVAGKGVFWTNDPAKAMQDLRSACEAGLTRRE